MAQKTVLFLDGVSCVGKTTIAERSVDFLKYLDSYPGFCNKNELMHVQNLYDHMVTNDVLNHLDELSVSDSSLDIVDRSFFSTMAYDMIFKYGGDHLNPDVFRTIVDGAIFNDRRYCELLANVWKSWELRFQLMYPSIEIVTIWIIPTDYDGVVRNLKSRATFENSFGNMRNYIANQCYIFKRLHEITKVGQLMFVEQYITNETLADYLEATRLRNVFAVGFRRTVSPTTS